MTGALVPELDVAVLVRSLAFYVGVLGFRVRYDRPEEQFAYLERQGAELMLQTAEGAEPPVPHQPAGLARTIRRPPTLRASAGSPGRAGGGRPSRS